VLWIAPPACIGTPYPAQLSESPPCPARPHMRDITDLRGSGLQTLRTSIMDAVHSGQDDKAVCPGYFSEEVIQILREAHLKGEWVPSLSQPCAKCGRRVPAENKAGQWIPQTHYPPQPYRSGKAGYKR
jgi:hypothetical protein